LAGLFRQMVRYGRGRVRLLRKHPDTFSLKSLAPAALLLGAAAGPLFALAWAPLGLVWAGVLLLYLAVLLAGGAALGLRQGRPALAPLFVLAFLASHAGAGWGEWCELLAGPAGPR